jgi:hypothetical protein
MIFVTMVAAVTTTLSGCVPEPAPTSTSTASSAPSRSPSPTPTGAGATSSPQPHSDEPTPDSAPQPTADNTARDLAAQACEVLHDSGLVFETLESTASSASILADTAANSDPHWQELATAITDFQSAIRSGSYGYDASVDTMIAMNERLNAECSPLGIVAAAGH